MDKLEWLRGVCSTAPYRANLHAPFGATVHGKRFDCASDGAMLLLIEGSDVATRTDAPPLEQIVPATFEGGEAIPLPRLRAWAEPPPPPPPPEKCGECDGAGKRSCGTCDGDGEHRCSDCDEYHDCGHCDGKGTVACDHCDGKGGPVEKEPPPHPGTLLGVTLSRRLLHRLIAGANDDRVFVRIDVGYFGAVEIAGTGWRAMLMPVRPAPNEEAPAFTVEGQP